MNKRSVFACLKDSAKDERFREGLLSMIESLECTVITVVIDKCAHLEKYKAWRYDPYHYCLMVVVERYVHWLEWKNACGDVMVESRGGGQDMRLKDSFERLLRRGSNYVEVPLIKDRLTSRHIKLSPKSKNIPGVQIADLIAHPSYRWVLDKRAGESQFRSNFGGRIAQILEERKYYRGEHGKVEGFGRKWLP